MTSELGHAMLTHMFSLYVSLDDMCLKKENLGRSFYLIFWDLKS